MPQPKSLATSGIQVLYGDVGTTPATLATELREITEVPQSKVKSYSTTNVNALNGDSTPDLNEYKGFGKYDNGQLTFTAGGDETQVSLFYSLKGVLKAWKILYSSGAYDLFNGAITLVGPKPKTGEEVSFTITIELSGARTFVTASAATAELIEDTVTKTASYNGASYDLGASFTAPAPGEVLKALLAISAIDRTTGDETYVFTFQQSSDNTTFTACGPAVSTIVEGTLAVAGLVTERYVRVAAVLGGTTPSITYRTTLTDLVSF